MVDWREPTGVCCGEGGPWRGVIGGVRRELGDMVEDSKKWEPEI
jgi:hypothetical protein